MGAPTANLRVQPGSVDRTPMEGPSSAAAPSAWESSTVIALLESSHDGIMALAAVRDVNPAFARAYAFCLANSTSREDLYGFADLIAGVLEELKLHRRYAERWQVDLSCVTPVAATNAYVDFLLETARRGDLGETIAAMTPCMRLYAFLGRSLAARTVAPLYAEWVKTYADPGFEAMAARIESLLDLHAKDCDTVRAAYRRAMELEYGFFDASV